MGTLPLFSILAENKLSCRYSETVHRVSEPRLSHSALQVLKPRLSKPPIMFSIILQDFHLFFEKQSFRSCLKDSRLPYPMEIVYLSTRNESPHSYSSFFNWGETVGTSSPPVLSFLLMHSGLTGWYLDPYRGLLVMILPSRRASWKTLPMVTLSRLNHLELSPVNSCVVFPMASR